VSGCFLFVLGFGKIQKNLTNELETLLNEQSSYSAKNNIVSLLPNGIYLSKNQQL